MLTQHYLTDLVLAINGTVYLRFSTLCT